MKLIRVIGVILLFCFSNINAYSLSIFGNFVVIPMKITEQWALSSGAAVSLSFDNWIFSIASYNDIIHNVKSDFSYTLQSNKAVKPRLINNFFEFETGKNVPITDKIGIVVSGKFAINHVKYRIIFDEFDELLELESLPDFGSHWYYTVAPAIGLSWKVGNWTRLSTSLAYRFPFNADYKVKNYENIHLKNSDLSGLSIVLKFQLGDLK